jgi:hypothetical protein
MLFYLLKWNIRVDFGDKMAFSVFSILRLRTSKVLSDL